MGMEIAAGVHVAPATPKVLDGTNIHIGVTHEPARQEPWGQQFNAGSSIYPWNNSPNFHPYYSYSGGPGPYGGMFGGTPNNIYSAMYPSATPTTGFPSAQPGASSMAMPNMASTMVPAASFGQAAYPYWTGQHAPTMQQPTFGMQQQPPVSMFSSGYASPGWGSGGSGWPLASGWHTPYNGGWSSLFNGVWTPMGPTANRWAGATVASTAPSYDYGASDVPSQSNPTNEPNSVPVYGVPEYAKPYHGPFDHVPAVTQGSDTPNNDPDAPPKPVTPAPAEDLPDVTVRVEGL